MDTKVHLRWDKLTDGQRSKVRRRVASRNQDLQNLHLYLKRLRFHRLDSNDVYIAVPSSQLRPQEYDWKVWRRMGKRAYARRRTFNHTVAWHLYGPKDDNGNRSQIPFAAGGIRQYAEDMALTLSNANRSRSKNST